MSSGLLGQFMLNWFGKVYLDGVGVEVDDLEQRSLSADERSD